jgi:hypothetical protein
MIVRGKLPPGPSGPSENELLAPVELEDAVCRGDLLRFAAKATPDPLAADRDQTDYVLRVINAGQRTSSYL